MISKEGFSVHNVLAIFWNLRVKFNESTTEIGKVVNFGNFQKMYPPFQKGVCWNGCRKGGLTICDTQELRLAENTSLIVFSAKNSTCRINGVSCTKTEHLPNVVGCCSRCEKVFSTLPFLFFGGFGFCFLVLLLAKSPQKCFCNLRGFFLDCSLKSPFFKILIFFFLVVFFFFLCLPFQDSVFAFCFFFVNPF